MARNDAIRASQEMSDAEAKEIAQEERARREAKALADAAEAIHAHRTSIPEGWVFGLAGRSVRKDGKVIGGVFATTGPDGKPISYDNVEAPFPVTADAAADCAADCTTTVYSLNADGSIKEHKLTGVVAAVAIALQGRPHETVRGKLRSGGIKGEDQLRSTMIGLRNFTVGRVEVAVSREDLAAILADPDVSADDKLAAMAKLIESAGAKVK